MTSSSTQQTNEQPSGKSLANEETFGDIGPALPPPGSAELIRAIKAAIRNGRKNAEQPPADHWLREYWHMGSQLAAGEATATKPGGPVESPNAEAAVDTPQLRRLVNEYIEARELTRGHAIPQWRRLVAHIIQLLGSSSRFAVTPALLAQQHIEGATAIQEVKRRLVGMIGNGDSYQQGYVWTLEMVEIVEAAFLAKPQVEVVADRGRLWIRKGVQSFLLAFEWDTDDEMQHFAATLREALFTITPSLKATPPQHPSGPAREMPELPPPDVRQAAAPVSHATAYSEELVRKIQRQAFVAGGGHLKKGKR